MAIWILEGKWYESIPMLETNQIKNHYTKLTVEFLLFLDPQTYDNFVPLKLSISNIVELNSKCSINANQPNYVWCGPFELNSFVLQLCTFHLLYSCRVIYKNELLGWLWIFGSPQINWGWPIQSYLTSIMPKTEPYGQTPS